MWNLCLLLKAYLDFQCTFVCVQIMIDHGTWRLPLAFVFLLLSFIFWDFETETSLNVKLMNLTKLADQWILEIILSLCPWCKIWDKSPRTAFTKGLRVWTRSSYPCGKHFTGILSMSANLQWGHPPFILDTTDLFFFSLFD